MQPSLLIEHPNSTTGHDTRGDRMAAGAMKQARAPASSAAALTLRLAQRAFAALIEDAARKGAGHGAFGAAQLRCAAQRTLSALSADDRPTLKRWLVLQFATGVALDSVRASRWLARMDAHLAANVGAAAKHVREQWRAARDNGTAA